MSLCHEKRGLHEAPGKSAKASGTKVCPYSHPSSQNASGSSAGNPLTTSADLCRTTPKHFKTMCRRPTPPGSRPPSQLLFRELVSSRLGPKSSNVSLKVRSPEKSHVCFYMDGIILFSVSPHLIAICGGRRGAVGACGASVPYSVVPEPSFSQCKCAAMNNCCDSTVAIFSRVRVSRY